MLTEHASNKNLPCDSKLPHNDKEPARQAAPSSADGRSRHDARYVFVNLGKKDERAGLPYHRRWRKRGKRLLKRGAKGLKLKARFGGALLLEIMCPRRLARDKSAVLRRVAGHSQGHSLKRLCIFSHFDRDDLIDPYVVRYLAELRRLGMFIVFVSTSERLGDDQIKAVLPHVGRVVVRRNTGRDFGSWRAGLAECPDLAAYDQVILANDSVYGPLFPLQDVFAAMDGRDLDIWGITDSLERGYHLQSYFLVFGRRAVASRFFERFWRRYRSITFKPYVVEVYELGLSRAALRHKLRLGAFCEYRAIAPCASRASRAPGEPPVFIPDPSRRPLNPTHYFWQVLLRELRCPFIKIDLLRDNPSRIPDAGKWRDVVFEVAPDFDREIIARHLARLSSASRPTTPVA
jgi:lipopolysaccharide biosynthesis protein